MCTFLNRYINELLQWEESGVSLQQKMKDDKFVVLAGDIYNLDKIDSTCESSILRYDNKAYEVVWKRDNSIILRVAFPIQYELLLGQSKKDIEASLDSLIMSADVYDDTTLENIHTLDSVAPDIYRVNGVEHYASMEILASSSYVRKDSLGGVAYLAEFGSALCKDAGQSAISGQIELVGKLAILAISMPVVTALFETIAGLSW